MDLEGLLRNIVWIASIQKRVYVMRKKVNKSVNDQLNDFNPLIMIVQYSIDQYLNRKCTFLHDFQLQNFKIHLKTCILVVDMGCEQNMEVLKKSPL